MNEQIKMIAERLKGLRESLDLTAEQFASECDVPVQDYNKCESGEVDIPVSLLHNISKKYGVEMTSLLFGEDPHMSSYFLTRKGQGLAMERTKQYKYQSLAAGFMNRIADPFIVTVEPNNNPIHLNSHPGQEFNLVLKGRMRLCINGKDLILGEGDSIYFNSSSPHGMEALDGESVQFLAVVL